MRAAGRGRAAADGLGEGEGTGSRRHRAPPPASKSLSGPGSGAWGRRGFVSGLRSRGRSGLQPPQGFALVPARRPVTAEGKGQDVASLPNQRFDNNFFFF